MLKLRVLILGGFLLVASFSTSASLESDYAVTRRGALQVACGTCHGSKACHVCDGTGTVSGTACVICSGSKKCYVCGGSGEF